MNCPFGKVLYGSSIIIMLIISGCLNDSSDTAEKVELEGGDQDGYIQILADLLPNITAGMIIADGEGAWVGVGMGGQNKLIMRSLFRFNMAQYERGSVEFYFKVRDLVGSPGKIDVYIVPDPGSLSTTSGDPIDLKAEWSSLNNGTRIKTVYVQTASSGSANPVGTPDDVIYAQLGRWFSITLSEEDVTGGISGGHLSIMFRARDENMDGGNAVVISTYESGDIPYYISH